MNREIEYYVDQIEAKILMNMAGQEDMDLYTITSELINQEAEDQLMPICQAYEVVKNNLLGTNPQQINNGKYLS